MSVFTHPDLPPGWEMHLFEETDRFSPDDVVALWIREGVLEEAEARRRVDEVLLVASDDQGSLAGVSSVYLAVNHQVRSPLWYLRSLVASEHRRSNGARVMIATTIDVLEERFLSGADTRAPGLCINLENEALARHYVGALTPNGRCFYIGTSDLGAPTFIRWFPGASVLQQ